jgi:O-acetyl-ADP-ribose deacetylase (regulator of RNase III)
MVIKDGSGSLLAADVDALVNTVNTVGVMGKGIALQFKQAYPANYKAYQRACKAGEITLGEMFVFDTGVLGPRRWIINFPTKGHWRSKSRLSDIDAGLLDLRRVLEENGIASVAVPALGCGNGGLDWDVVRPRIEGALAGLSNTDVWIFPPSGAPDPASMPVHTERPRMTMGRAVLIAVTAAYHRRADALQSLVTPLGASLLEMQKLMYLVQVRGQPLQLQYVKGLYGPYAENLNKVLQATEGHYTRGYGDRSAAVLRLAPIALLPGAVEEADAFLDGEPGIRSTLADVVQLLDGFESPYGLELLTTVHFAATQLAAPTRATPELVIKTVQDWNQRKKELFRPGHIRAALEQLTDQGWLEPRPAA